jgi:hypothetical protein
MSIQIGQVYERYLRSNHTYDMYIIVCKKQLSSNKVFWVTKLLNNGTKKTFPEDVLTFPEFQELFGEEINGRSRIK